ncbi:MAG: hypothetical protein ACRBBP_04475 [Bdellovibrionales bacterium]
MQSFIQILLFLISSQSWALTAIEVGSKYPLNKSKSYHFSSKDLVSTHISPSSPFFIALKVGVLNFKENNTTQKILILNKEQLRFFNTTNFIIENSPFLNWDVQEGKLVVKGQGSSLESTTLLKTCSSQETKSVAILTTPPPEKHPNRYKNCLSLQKTFKVELAFLNENNLSGSTFGLGVPSELSWVLDPKIKFENIKGSANFSNNQQHSKGHTFFTSTIEPNTPLVFESGEEVLIKPSGLFNRQKNEWKKATSNIEINVLKVQHNTLNTEFKINRAERTGESQVFSIEKLQKNQSLRLNKWVKVFTFKQDSSSRSKNKILNLSILGRKNKSLNNSNKQFWVKVSEND